MKNTDSSRKPLGSFGRFATLLFCLWTAIAATGGAHANGIEDAERARELVNTGAILPLSHFLEQVEKHHPGRIIEAELEYEAYHGGRGYVYEIEILDREGQVWELEFHAETGELVEREQESY